MGVREWVIETSAAFAKRGKPLPSVLFMHIPSLSYTQASGGHAGTGDVSSLPQGCVGSANDDSISTPRTSWSPKSGGPAGFEQQNVVEALVERGTRAIFVGHD